VAAFWLLYKTAMYVGIIVMRRPQKRVADRRYGGEVPRVDDARRDYRYRRFCRSILWVKNITGLVTV